VKRREFIALLGCAAMWPLMARSQQAVPVVAVLSSGPQGPMFEPLIIDELQKGGFIDGQNVRLELRFADGAFEKLPGMMAELLSLRPSVMWSLGTAAARVAKDALQRASSPVPLVFSFGGDPVAERMVASFNRPGGNITGVTSIAGSLAPKRVELLSQLVQRNTRLALMVNPNNPLAEREGADVAAAAKSLGQALMIIPAADNREIEAGFAKLHASPVTALIIAVDTVYYGRMKLMGTLAARFRIPAVGPLREFSEAGGLMSYGANIPAGNRQAAEYVVRVLKGEKPADLPVLQPTKFELVINLKAAKSLGIAVPSTLLATADEVIE
jgi:putative ABC transport system substrate-binding protein